MCAMMTCCDPGDKVIVFSPFYENYAADAILSGAEPIYVPLRPPQFGFDPDELARAFAQGAKAIIVCNPSNPTGKVFTRAELQTILDLAEKHDAFVITDEPYEHIVYAPHEHVYMHSLPGAADRVIVCNSLSKTYSITGWRLGYVQAAPHIIAQARKVHDFLTVGAAAPLARGRRRRTGAAGQLLRTACAISTPRSAMSSSAISAPPACPSPNRKALTTCCIDISSLGFATDTEAAEWFVREIGVAGVPGSSFFREPEHRFTSASTSRSCLQGGGTPAGDATPIGNARMSSRKASICDAGSFQLQVRGVRLELAVFGEDAFHGGDGRFDLRVHRCERGCLEDDLQRMRSLLRRSAEDAEVAFLDDAA
jgi:aspartate/methionine/tyrosine aminotransferase